MVVLNKIKGVDIMFKVILKEKGHPITKKIERVKEMLFLKHDGKDRLYIMFYDSDNWLRSMGVDLANYDTFEVKTD